MVTNGWQKWDYLQKKFAGVLTQDLVLAFYF
jgi:hypothetical protein